ncbi:cytoplasmic tRNA 2-thiolation protein 2 isoform X2 [Dromiciops gliroides]|uniref:cytoplasmic tRNA 2-thiolation protein 2 isoform X2 n=1 Tax=Dromiciops gliroides TaxID=33562 RepID=UPI001CC686CC|nr:cytoplasmic tRNA 2-thiolation protein 2 isoform X2 [Dromiciops gliroides]
MCQVGEDYGGPGPAELQPKLPWRGCEQKCMKCKEGWPVLIIRAGDAFCKDCFKAYYIHKFRAMLGKNRLIFPGEKVLLAWSGGPSSSSMIWQVQEGLSRESAKRLRFVPGIIFVDEGAVCGQSLEERKKTVAEIQLILQTVGFLYHIVSLEEVFNLPTSVLQTVPQSLRGSENTYKEAVDGFIQRQQQQRPPEEAVLSDEQIQEKLRQLSTRDPGAAEEVAGEGLPRPAQTTALMELFNSVKTLTAKEELLQTLRAHLILHVARVHGYSKVMLGDSCTRLAIKLMTNLALGRGAFLAWDTGFSDDRHGDVVLLRPMRDYTLKEIAFYNRMFGVPSVFSPAIDTKAPEKASIHRLMESFILRLQAQFPSTISTVYRTSEKLVKAPRDGDAASPEPARCLLCMCTLDIDSADSATAFGAQTSEYLCQRAAPTPALPTGAPGRPCCASGTEPPRACCQNARLSPAGEDPRASFIEQLCYSCRVNMKDMPLLEPLPPYILKESQRRSQRAWVKQEIQEFLFEEIEEEVRDEICPAES